MKVYITDVTIPKIEYLEKLVSKERVERALKFRNEIDRRRSLSAEALLNHVLKENFPEIKVPVSLSIDEFEKPFLTGTDTIMNGETMPNAEILSTVSFNLSHSGDYALCAIGTHSLGCDIERRKENNVGVARRFFTRKECEHIADVDAFFTYWTLKESFVKAVGKGLSMPMNSFEVQMGTDRAPVSYVCDSIETQYIGKNFDEIDGYFVAVCGETTEELPEKIQWIIL